MALLIRWLNRLAPKATASTSELRSWRCHNHFGLHETGCPVGNRGRETTSYPGQTQAVAATRLISRHRGHIGLISVSIGANDVFVCDIAAQLLSCAKSVLRWSRVIRPGSWLLCAKSAAWSADRRAYLTPDVFLGSYLSPARNKKRLAMLSVTEFLDLKPDLERNVLHSWWRLRRHDQGDGRLHAVGPDHDLWSLRGNSGGRCRGLCPYVLLPAPRRSPEDPRLYHHRSVNVANVAEPALALQKAYGRTGVACGDEGAEQAGNTRAGGPVGGNASDGTNISASANEHRL